MTSEILIERAPAKVNLTLHVVGRRADGYHELESLVVFAGVGDTLRLVPGPSLDLQVDGEMAEASGPPERNLVLRAAASLDERVPGLRSGRFHLTKRLPAAAGIGGGSSDAAAALRLLARLNALPHDAPALIEAARAVGADVSVCLSPRATMMRGIGDVLSGKLPLPPVFAVLVNPRVAVPTADVFRALGLAPGERLGRPAHAPAPAAASELVPMLRAARNDLEAPAMAVEGIVAQALERVAGTNACRLARMSGSGATVFGLYDDRRATLRAARALRSSEPGWWIRPTILR